MSFNLNNFKFNEVKKGYDPAQVKEFVGLVVDEYASIVDQNNKLEKEIDGLVGKLNQFKEIEDALSRALIAAQIESNNIVSSANDERANLIRKAEGNAEGLIQEALKRVGDIEDEIMQLKENAHRYKARLKGIVESQLEMMKDVDSELRVMDREVLEREKRYNNVEGDIPTDPYF